MVGKAFDEEWSPNTQPMDGGKSPGPRGLKVVFCDRMQVCEVSEICGDWQRDAHVDGRAMEATTSATHPHQPQATQLMMPASNHTPQCIHTTVHIHGWMAAERVDDHTVFTITPSIHPNHTLHHQLCAGQHPHSDLHSCHLLAPLGKKHNSVDHEHLDNVLFCIPCHPVGLYHSCPRQWPSHCMSLPHSLCFRHSRENAKFHTVLFMETTLMAHWLMHTNIIMKQEKGM